jgi:hypothetical protein
MWQNCSASAMCDNVVILSQEVPSLSGIRRVRRYRYRTLEVAGPRCGTSVGRCGVWAVWKIGDPRRLTPRHKGMVGARPSGGA